MLVLLTNINYAERQKRYQQHILDYVERLFIMSISRSPSTPLYHEYITKYALVPYASTPEQVSDLYGLLKESFQWVDIPQFQRGISWDVDDIVDEFLPSKSILLGNVIMSQFLIEGRFPNIPSGFENYLVLVDGLQRLAIGTMLLNALYPLVLQNTPNRPGDAQSFRPLAAHVSQFAVVFQHNDREFRNHSRKALSDQYSKLADKLSAEVKSILEEGGSINQQHVNNILSSFLNKRVAVDIYHGFTSSVQLMNTFLGLNTVRVDLGPIDLLRAYIVERATGSGWHPSDVETIENDFTEIFTNNEKPNPELLPFISVILNAIKSPTLATKVFPTWQSGLSLTEVQDFLEFVREFLSCRGMNGYVDEVRDCGGIPFATLLIYYYVDYVRREIKPSFLHGGIDENIELHKFLIANYRVVLDGRISRTRHYTERVLSGAITSLEVVAQQMSQQFVRTDINKQVERSWLRTCLARIDKNKSRRIFNAMILPELTGNNRSSGWGNEYSPLVFGRKSTESNIDHLIPDSMKLENAQGYAEVNSIRNFSPLPSNQNRIAKATSCSTKLSDAGIYYMVIASNPNYHPYLNWLLTHASSMEHRELLDQQAYLEPNQQPSIGDERLDHITDRLLTRI